MTRYLHRWLLRLLPRRRRQQYGDEMTVVFSDLRKEARRVKRRPVAQLGLLWMREVSGMAKFALRERFFSAPSGPGWRTLTSELRWARRGVRARGWRAALVVLLVGIALAGNLIVFAVADAVVLTRLPYPRAHEIVEIHSGSVGQRPSRWLSPALLDEWRRQTDLFVSVQGYLTKTVFVLTDGPTEFVQAADVTPGLVELLGVRPKWGRTLIEADANETGTVPALIAEPLARKLFGRPEAAVGRAVDTTAYPLLIVGVIPAGFGFPTGLHQLWRALDPRGPLAADAVGVSSIARRAPHAPADLTAAVVARSRLVGDAAGAGARYEARVEPLYTSASVSERVRAMFLLLLGGAACLLLTACANLASLELAGALRRSRVFAVQMALGASRAILARVALLEGALLIGAAAVAGTALARAGIGVVQASMPSTMLWAAPNAIDLDGRAMIFMLGVAAATWLLASAPLVLHVKRTHPMDLLKTDDRAAASRGGRMVRHVLTIAEVAAATALVLGGALYTRSYAALLGADKGFDSTNLVVISFTMPPDAYRGPGQIDGLADAVLTRLRTVPGVVGAVCADPPPYVTSPRRVILEIAGRRQPEGEVLLRSTPASPGYFDVLRLPLRHGRWLMDNEPPDHVLVSESFARTFWPEGTVVGSAFRSSVGDQWKRIVGVVGEFRTRRPDETPATREYHYYTPPQRSTAPALVPVTEAPGSRPPSSGTSTQFMSVTARLDSPVRATAVLDAARSVDPRLRVTLESVDDKYASMFADMLLAMRVTSAFGVLAFLVAIVGVYGVMAYLVAGRRREIGIRMALGADRRDIAGLVLASSARLVVIGAALGLGGALLLSRWVASQFYGVSATDPVTYMLVGVTMLATALVATWHPARQAAGVDPAITLRN